MLDETNELPTIIDIILIPDFSLMAFTSAIEPLRSANRLSGKTLYDWRVVSVDGSSVISSNGVEIVPSGALDIIQKPKLIFVISGYGVQFYNNEKLFSFLRKSAREGCPWRILYGGICSSEGRSAERQKMYNSLGKLRIV